MTQEDEQWAAFTANRLLGKPVPGEDTLHVDDPSPFPWDDKDGKTARFPAPDATAIQARRLEQYDRFVSAARNLFMGRNATYGDAFSEIGLVGSTAELAGVTARLKQLVLKDPAWVTGRPSVDTQLETYDKLLDAINYGLICLMLLQDDNFTGE